MKVFPKKKGMILRRFKYKMRFVCSSCVELVDSEFRAETIKGVICNRCYGQRLRGITPKKKTDVPPPTLPMSDVHGTKTGRISTLARAPKHVGLRNCKRLHLTPSDCGKEGSGCVSD